MTCCSIRIYRRLLNNGNNSIYLKFTPKDGLQPLQLLLKPQSFNKDGIQGPYLKKLVNKQNIHPKFTLCSNVF